MKKSIYINQKIDIFKKKSIFVPGDKSLSIRFILLSSLSKGKCTGINILRSDDVLSAVNCIRKLGIKIYLKNQKCEVFGKGLNGYKFSKNLTLNAGNSGTTARLLCAILINSPQTIKIIGDKSLNKRDMNRIIKPLKKFGIRLISRNGKLPIYIKGIINPRPIIFRENLGSAQCKTAVMLAGLKTNGTTKLQCLPSRNHTELMFKNVLKIPIKIKTSNKYDIIELNGQKEFNSFNYKIPGDISSAAFFLVLTLLSEKKALTIKSVNINPSRIGIINILNLMGAKIKFFNKKIYKGELKADIFIESKKDLKGINLDPKLNSSAIDEFLLIFLVASRCKGISTFKELTELNKKESKRLNWGLKILKMMGVKTKKTKNNGIKIWGKPNLTLNKHFTIKNFLKDHRIFMTTTIAALTLGGSWKIHDPDSYKTSFPSFLEELKRLGAKIK